MAKNYPLDAAHTIEGVWWRPSHEDDTVAGTLVYDPETGLRLRLIGALGDIEEVLGRVNAPGGSETLHGVSTDGRSVTLLKAVHASANLSFPGMIVEEYVAVWALIGNHVVDIDAAEFFRSETAFDGLAEWLARDAIERTVETEPRRITLVAEPKPKWVLGTVDDFTVFADMVLNWDDDRLTRSALTVSNSLGVETAEARSLQWHIDRLARLNRLVALCTGRHLSWRSIWLSAGERALEGGGKVQNRIDVLVQLNGQSQTKRENDPPIYSAKELVAANDQAMARWFAVADDLEPVIDLFFTVLSDRGLPLEAAFLLTAQAVEVHHRRTGASVIIPAADYDAMREAMIAGIPDDAPAAMREKLEGSLSFANEPSLGQRLRAIVERVSEDFGARPFGFDPARIRAAVNTRNYYTHYSPKLETKAKTGLELHELTEAFKPLLFTLLLAELQLPLTDIRRRLQRRRAFKDV